jgi:CheY-like chemotaxis protein
VDDHRSLREMLALALAALGCEVRTAANGADGLAALHTERFDLILTDLYMPAMDGFQFAQRAKAAAPGTPVALISASSPNLTRDQLRDLGIDGFLPKPFAISEIEILLASLARGPDRARAGAA